MFCFQISNGSLQSLGSAASQVIVNAGNTAIAGNPAQVIQQTAQTQVNLHIEDIFG